ncbi:hypothetical protein [Clostridium sp. UBA5988]|uniref:hypothetical protein n=1 Tax=Clostridium sp. UBA5988 TaxID=1946369 RepID=UPI003216E73E
MHFVTAIINELIQEEFKVKMEELKENQLVTKVTEEDIRDLLTRFREYVVTKNIPECKNFI